MQHQRVLADVSNTQHDAAAAASRGAACDKQRAAGGSVALCASGFRGPAAKAELQQLASAIPGASLSYELQQGRTTHLVCRRLIDAFGTPKFVRALQWGGVAIVSYRWLQDSAAAGRALPAGDYVDDVLAPSPARSLPAVQRAQPACSGEQQEQEQEQEQEQRQQQQEQRQQPLSSQRDEAPARQLSLAPLQATPRGHHQGSLQQQPSPGGHHQGTLQQPRPGGHHQGAQQQPSPGSHHKGPQQQPPSPASPPPAVALQQPCSRGSSPAAPAAWLEQQQAPREQRAPPQDARARRLLGSESEEDEGAGGFDFAAGQRRAAEEPDEQQPSSPCMAGFCPLPQPPSPAQAPELDGSAQAQPEPLLGSEIQLPDGIAAAPAPVQLPPLGAAPGRPGVQGCVVIPETQAAYEPLARPLARQPLPAPSRLRSSPPRAALQAQQQAQQQPASPGDDDDGGCWEELQCGQRSPAYSSRSSSSGGSSNGDSTQQQQQQHSQAGGSQDSGAASCGDGGRRAGVRPASGHSSSGGGCGSFAGLRRLRRGAAGADAPGSDAEPLLCTAELAELEDSDCALHGDDDEQDELGAGSSSSSSSSSGSAHDDAHEAASEGDRGPDSAGAWPAGDEHSPARPTPSSGSDSGLLDDAAAAAGPDAAAPHAAPAGSGGSSQGALPVARLKFSLPGAAASGAASGSSATFVTPPQQQSWQASASAAAAEESEGSSCSSSRRSTSRRGSAPAGGQSHAAAAVAGGREPGGSKAPSPPSEGSLFVTRRNRGRAAPTGCSVQQQQPRVAAPKPPQPSPGEALLRELARRQAQQRQAGAARALEAVDAAPDPVEPPETQPLDAGPQRPAQRQSMATSCCTTGATGDAGRRVPLPLHGPGLLLLGADGAGSCSNGDDGLQRMLQQTLADAAAAQAARQQAAPAAPAAGGGAADASPAAPAGPPAQWLHTPEEEQQRRPAAAAPVGLATAMQQRVGLAHLSQASGEPVPLKLLVKAPRGSTAKAAHGLKPAARLVYAEQLQVPWAHATLSTKERSRALIVAAGEGGSSGGGTSSSGSGGGVFLAEPLAFYQLPSGEWCVELLRFYAAADLRARARAAGRPLALPPDFSLRHELLRGIAHQHVPLARVLHGEFRLSKVRKAPTSGKALGRFFWRFSLDDASAAGTTVLTDRPVTDLVLE